MRSTYVSLLVSVFMTSSAFAFPVSHPEAVNGGVNEGALPIQKAIMTDADVEKLKLEQIGNEREESATNPHTDQRINMTIEGNLVRGGPDFNAAEAYDAIAIVNKAADVQTLTLHRFKTVDGRRIAIAPITYKVSTGKRSGLARPLRTKRPARFCAARPAGQELRMDFTSRICCAPITTRALMMMPRC